MVQDAPPARDREHSGSSGSPSAARPSVLGDGRVMGAGKTSSRGEPRDSPRTRLHKRQKAGGGGSEVSAGLGGHGLLRVRC